MSDDVDVLADPRALESAIGRALADLAAAAPHLGRAEILAAVMRIAMGVVAEDHGLDAAATGDLLATRPGIPDAAIRRAAEGIRMHEGRRVSYRAIDLEVLGVVYASLRPAGDRRRGGAHYTPRSLTAPVVETTLDPILAACRSPEEILDLKIADPAMGSGAFLIEACRQLGDALARSWRDHGVLPDLSPGEDPVTHARRQIASRCLFGVDIDPVAVEIARLSIWILTRAAEEAPLAFLDRSIRHGDALVGLSRAQILGGADLSPEDARLAGDAAVAAFFAEGGARRIAIAEAAAEARRSLAAEGGRAALARRAAALGAGEAPIAPFHWEIALPSVFSRENPGFDAVVGNPPFAGKNTLARTARRGMPAWLKAIHPGSHGNADLVAHFVRRSFGLIREGGTFGIVATNTIAQGDTRSSGLRFVCEHGGSIYAATRRLRWPAPGAAVIVSVVHARRGPIARATLDGRPVARVSAYLFDRGGDGDPRPLRENQGKSFQGPIALGMGFTFDDSDRSGRASKAAEIARLARRDPRNLDRIFPYLGGEELLSSPTQSPRRSIIHFGEMSEAEARAFPDLMRIVEERVRPDRLAQNDRGAKDRWWQFIRPRPELERAMRGLPRVIMAPFLSSHLCFAFVPATTVVAGPCNVFPTSSSASFAMLQSRVHEVWARFFSSSLKDDLRYTPSRCFVTFPFPIPFDPTVDPATEAHRAALEAAGCAYDAHRAAVMITRSEGLTAIYNRFHDPAEQGRDIADLRSAHAEMDGAVLAAYGFGDVPAACSFFPDRAEARGKKKRFRFRWPDEVEAEILARLVDLNAQRAATR